MTPTIQQLQVACFVAAQKMGFNLPLADKVRQAALTLGDQNEELQDLKQIVIECSKSSVANAALKEYIRCRPNLFK